MAKSAALQAAIDAQIKRYPNSPFTKFLQGSGDAAFADEDAKVLSQWEAKYPVTAEESAAAEQAASTQKTLAESTAALQNIQKQSAQLGINRATDLTGADDTPTIVAGGTADVAAASVGNSLKKKLKGGGVASQLGVNI